MAVTTFEVFGIFALAIFLAIAILFYVMSLQRKKFLDDYSYARAANASVPSTKTSALLNLSCEGKEICVYRATQVCSGNNSEDTENKYNFENSTTDPIASGIKGIDGIDGVGYGEFNPETTIDQTKSLADSCNGKSTCSTFKFTPSETKFPDGSAWSCGLNSQFISTYACIAPGAECVDYSGTVYKPPST